MKRILALTLAAALLGGCAIVPLDYGYRGDGWRGHRHYRDDGPRRDYGYGNPYRRDGRDDR